MSSDEGRDAQHSQASVFQLALSHLLSGFGGAAEDASGVVEGFSGGLREGRVWQVRVG